MDQKYVRRRVVNIDEFLMIRSRSSYYLLKQCNSKGQRTRSCVPMHRNCTDYEICATSRCGASSLTLSRHPLSTCKQKQIRGAEQIITGKKRERPLPEQILLARQNVSQPQLAALETLHLTLNTVHSGPSPCLLSLLFSRHCGFCVLIP